MSSKIVKTIILGAPGGGKGTISKKIVKDFKFEHVSSGDLLRHNVHNRTDLGKVAESYMIQGALVPDAVVMDMIFSRAQNSTSSLLLDGFPRTIVQAISLQKLLSIDAVIALEIPHQTIIDRLSNRWVHGPSGRTYAYDYNPPKILGKDDITGEDLIQRDDDKKETIKRRLETFEKQTRPLIEFYSSAGVTTKFRSFTGTESDVIYPEVRKFLQTEVFS